MADQVQKFLNGVANPQNMAPWNGNPGRNQLGQAGQNNWSPLNGRPNNWNGAPNANWANGMNNGMNNGMANWANGMNNGMNNGMANGMANGLNNVGQGLSNAGKGLGSALSTMSYNDLQDMDLYMADVEICEDDAMNGDSCPNPQ